MVYGHKPYFFQKARSVIITDGPENSRMRVKAKNFRSDDFILDLRRIASVNFGINRNKKCIDSARDLLVPHMDVQLHLLAAPSPITQVLQLLFV